MIHLSFAGQDFVPLAEGALFWPAREALLVADLHLEKASWYATGGQMLPPYDSLATLDALTQAISRTGAREVWCLGDSFHDDAGTERLPDLARMRLSMLIRRVEWTWITGNHDAGLAGQIGGKCLEAAVVDDILLRHEALGGEPRPEISGHFHPKLRIVQRGRSVSRRCFVASAKKLILPAFGSLAGGLDAGDPAILDAAGRPADAYVATSGRLLRFPLAA